MNKPRLKKDVSKQAPATLKEAVQGREILTSPNVLGIDIEHFKRTLDLFKYSLDYAEAIVNTVREPLVVLNKNLQVMTANNAFYQAFDIIPENLENKPFYEVGNGELNIPKFKKLLKMVLINDKSFENFEIEYATASKGKRILLLNARKFYRKINNTETILLAIEDVTKQRNFEKQKDEFAALIMHELKNPVSTLSGYLHLTQAHLSKNGDIKILEYTKIMKEQVYRLTSLINGLLNSSQIRAVGFDYNNSVFEIGELIDQTIESVQVSCKTHKLVLKNKINRYIEGDRDRISQVLVNLLINAIKYSPNANIVEIKVELNKNKIIISVIDFGFGISKENQKKVFDRFFKVRGSQNNTYYGIGLGLDISSQIVRHHKGKIWVESSKEEGSIFSFSLPTHQSKRLRSK